MKTKTLAALLLLALPLCAQQQGFRIRRVDWQSSLGEVLDGSAFDNRRRMRMLGMAAPDKKFIFVYVQPPGETKEPNEFKNDEAINASNEEWAFVKVDFDKENPHLKAWGIRGAPAVVGCDLHGNDFAKAHNLAWETMRPVLRNTPDLIQRYQAKLVVDYQKAMDTFQADEDKGARLFVEICQTGKNGYKEVTDSRTRLREISDAAMRKGDIAACVSPDAGVEYYDELAKIYRGTAPGAKAEVQAARFDHARGNVQAAIQRLHKVQKYDPRAMKAEVEAAARALDEISKSGEAKLAEALQGADKTLAREAARRIAKDYAGTEAGKKALDAAK